MERQHWLLLQRSSIAVDLHSARTRSFSLTNESKVSLVSSWTSLAVARAARAARPKAYFIVDDKKEPAFLVWVRSSLCDWRWQEDGLLARYLCGGGGRVVVVLWRWSGVKGQVVYSAVSASGGPDKACAQGPRTLGVDSWQARASEQSTKLPLSQISLLISPSRTVLEHHLNPIRRASALSATAIRGSRSARVRICR